MNPFVVKNVALNCGEFAIIKICVVHRLPDSEELDGIAISQPIGDEEVTLFGFEGDTDWPMRAAGVLISLKDREVVMPYDPEEQRREQNAHFDKQLDQKRLEEEREKLSEAVRVSILKRDPSIANDVWGIPPAAPSSAGTPRTPTAGEQFRDHSRLLICHLDSIWDGMFPAELTNHWRSQIALLDIEKTAQSLPVATALRESFLQARAQYKPSHTDMSRAMRFEDKAPRIGDEIQWLIDILRHVLAIERSR